VQENFHEIYAKDKKDLTTLIQEWIDENIEYISCKCINRELEYKHNNR